MDFNLVIFYLDSEMLLFILFQDLLFLACSHPENRSSLTKMEEWPEWILEVLISNYEALSSNFDMESFIMSFPYFKYSLKHVIM